MAAFQTGNPHNRSRDVSRAISRIQAAVLAMVCAIICGLGLFGMTAWLLIKGGENVGAHLQLLSHYFIGYSVSWPGSIVGFFYGALFGGIAGWTVGKLYNGVVNWRHH